MTGSGRLIPLTLVPLWDPELAAAEVRRCAAKGSYAIAFTENPSKLGFPSLYTGEWDLLWEACVETDTVGVDAHRLVVDRCRRRPTTRRSRRRCRSTRRTPQGSLCDWVFSGTLRALPDAQDRVRREPGRLDAVPARAHGRRVARGRRRRRPARRRRRAYVRGRVFGCIFDDLHGLTQPRRGRPRAHPVRDRLPARRTARGRTRSPVAHRLCREAGMDAGRVRAARARQRDRLLRPRTLRSRRLTLGPAMAAAPPTWVGELDLPDVGSGRARRAPQPARVTRARRDHRARRASRPPTTSCSACCAARPGTAARRRGCASCSGAAPAA